MKKKSHNNLEETRKYQELKHCKQNTDNHNDNVCITQTRNKDNQQRESKADKPMPSCSEKWKARAKTT